MGKELYLEWRRKSKERTEYRGRNQMILESYGLESQ